MNVTKNDILMEMKCEDCDGALIIIPEHGYFLQHEDAEQEADHSVSRVRRVFPYRKVRNGVT